MKNFAIVSVLLACFLVVSVTSRSYAVVDLAKVSAAMKPDYAPGRFHSDKHFSSQVNNFLGLLLRLAPFGCPFLFCLNKAVSQFERLHLKETKLITNLYRFTSFAYLGRGKVHSKESTEF